MAIIKGGIHFENLENFKYEQDIGVIRLDLHAHRIKYTHGHPSRACFE